MSNTNTKNSLIRSRFIAYSLLLLVVLLACFSIWKAQTSGQQGGLNFTSSQRFAVHGSNGPIGTNAPSFSRQTRPSGTSSISKNSGGQTPSTNQHSWTPSSGQRAGTSFNSSQQWGGSNGTHSFNRPGFSTPGGNGWNKTGLAIYGVFFLGGMISWVIFRTKRTTWEFKDSKASLWSTLGIGLCLRLALAPWVGGHMDMRLFENWAQVASHGLTQFYSSSASDYPPFYVYILYLIGKLTSFGALSSQVTLLIKLPSILTDTLTAYLFYRLAQKKVSQTLSLLIAGFYLLNPAILINSTFWGQVDSFFTLFLVLALVLLAEKKIMWSTLLFVICVLIKPQGIIFFPILFFEMIRRKRLKPFIGAIIIACITIEVVCFPFTHTFNPLWLLQLFQKTIGEYPYASVNGYNFYSLIGANYINDTKTLFLFSYHTWGLLFIVLITAYSWFLYIKSGEPRIIGLLALIQITGVFTFSTSMHERYLFSAVALALLSFIYLKDKQFIYLSAGFSLTVFVNQFVILYGNSGGSQFGGHAYTPTLFIISLLNVCLFGYLVKIAWDLVMRTRTISQKNEAEKESLL